MTQQNVRALRRTRPAKPSRTRPRDGAEKAVDSVLWFIVTANVVLTPLIIALTGHDVFRAPKEYLLRGGSILIIAVLAIRWLYFPRTTWHQLARNQVAVTLALAVLTWTAVSSAFSTNLQISVWTVLRVALCTGFFAGALIAVRSKSLTAVYILLAPAVVNAALLLLQVTNIWDPLYHDADLRTPSALIGNSNDVGAFLLIAGIAAAALFFASTDRKALHLTVALFLFTGVLAARSAAAIGAYVVAIVTLGALLSWRKALAAAGVAALLLAFATATYSPLRQRAITIRNAVSARDYNLLSSYRLTAFVTAAKMFRHHPLLGVGPGCYAWNYFDYKIAAEHEYPILREPGDHLHFMFAEAHSDHLQIMAVSGLPGYLLFLTAIALVGKGSLGRRQLSASDTARMAHFCSLPVAAGTATIALAQFPLELAATTVSLLYVGAMCMGWHVRENS